MSNEEQTPLFVNNSYSEVVYQAADTNNHDKKDVHHVAVVDHVNDISIDMGSTAPMTAYDGGDHDDDSISSDHTGHLGASRQYWRDIILAVNDGLVSTFLLVAGVAGAGLASRDIMLTAISGATAGAVSMCAGEYVATKSQNDVMLGELEVEKMHIKEDLESEVKHSSKFLEMIGIPRKHPLHHQLLHYYRSNPDELFKMHVCLEFGVVEDEQRNPFTAGLVSFCLFFLGSLPSVIPFLFPSEDTFPLLIGAAIMTTVALLVVGAIKSWATRGNCFAAAMENLLIAGCGGILAYGVGVSFEAIIS